MHGFWSRPATLILLALGASGLVPLQAAYGKNHGIGLFDAIPFQGDIARAMQESIAGATIPMASFNTVASKDGNTYSDTVVGASPLAVPAKTTTVNFLIVPVIVHIGTTTFSPRVTDTCITPNTSPLAAFQGSPLLQQVIFDGQTAAGHASTINGVKMGASTFGDVFRRAEFWSVLKGTKYHLAFKVTVSPAWTISAATVQSLGGGNVFTTDCAPIGVLPSGSFESLSGIR